MLSTASSILRPRSGRATGRTASTVVRPASRARLAAVLGSLGALIILVAGCDGGAAADQPAAQSSTPIPTPTAAPAASIKPMVVPTKPYPVPSMPAKPAKTDELTSIGYGVKRVAWASAGTVDPTTSAACATTNAKLVVEKAALRFDCVVTAGGIRTTFAITSTTGAEHITWNFKVARLPVTEKKVEYEASRQAFKPARVTCDVDGTELVPLGDPDAITCWVAQTDNTSVTYHGGLDANGVITFALAPTPSPRPTRTSTATPRASSASPTPSTS